MAWHDELAADLPEPRPSDPPALRHDILDELADHLACAADREQLRGGDDAEIAARVRDRFGDPARIARQLWIEALKERLMRERITIVFAAVLAVAAAVACGLLWSAVRDTRESLTAALEQNREAAARNAESNAALLARIEELSKSADQMSSFAMEWNPVRVTLVKGEDGTEPAVGYRASLTGGPYEAGMRKQQGQTGPIDFGHVQPGQYMLTVATPWGAFTSRSLQVTPGTKIDQTIACPAEEVVAADVGLEIEWPDDLPSQIDAAVITVSDPVQPFGEDHWLLPPNRGDMTFLLRRNGTVTQSSFPGAMSSRFFTPSTRPGEPSSALSLLADAEIKIALVNRRSPNRSPPPDWRTARYSLSRIALISEAVIQTSRAALPRARVRSPDDSPFSASRGTPFVGVVSLATTEEPRAEGELPLEEPQSFTAEPGQPNVWRIRLPAATVEQARERISRFESALDEQRQQPPVEAPQPAAS